MKTIYVLLCLLLSGPVLHAQFPVAPIDVSDTAKFAGLLNLPPESFLFALEGADQELTESFYNYGLDQIGAHPQRAKRYSLMLKLLMGTRKAEAMEADHAEATSTGFRYGTPLGSQYSRAALTQSSLGGDEVVGGLGLVDQLSSFRRPVAAFFTTAFDVVASIVSFVCVTLGCLILTAAALIVVIRLTGEDRPYVVTFRGRQRTLL